MAFQSVAHVAKCNIPYYRTAQQCCCQPESLRKLKNKTRWENQPTGLFISPISWRGFATLSRNRNCNASMRRRIIRKMRPSHLRLHSEEAVRLTKHLLLASNDARVPVAEPGLPGSTTAFSSGGRHPRMGAYALSRSLSLSKGRRRVAETRALRQAVSTSSTHAASMFRSARFDYAQNDRSADQASKIPSTIPGAAGWP